jgi:putative hydrolase of the HAD superfamily
VGQGGRVLRGLLMDWGGVLTSPLDSTMSAWVALDGVDVEHFRDVLRTWIGPESDRHLDPPPDPHDPATVIEESDRIVAAAPEPPFGDSPAHRLERGEISTHDFERLLAEELTRRGSAVASEGLLRRMLVGLEHGDAAMLELVARAKARGIRTALLSNSWGNHYPESLWDGLFDAIVISGRVGMRKPESRIYRYAAELIDVSPADCVLVDDLPRNVQGAVEVGMVGVLHRSYDQTVVELEALFEVTLQAQGACDDDPAGSPRTSGR